MRKDILHKTKTVALSGLYRLLRALLLLGLSFVLLYPLLYMISMAFRPEEQIYDPSVIWVPKSWTLDNIKYVFNVMHYPKALLTTLRVNMVSALLQVASASLVGYGFARFQFRTKKLWFVLVIVTILVPYQIILNPLYLEFRNFDMMGILKVVSLITGQNLMPNLLNTSATFYLPAVLTVGLKGGLIIFLFRQFFKGMPQELEDAAAVDGCGFFSCFWRVVLPNAVPVIITALVLSGVWYWNDSFIGSTLLANNRTVMVSLIRLQSELLASMNLQITSIDPFQLSALLQAGCLLSILPVLLAYLFVQRGFVQSVQRAGIVG